MKKITDLCAKYDMDEEDLKVLNESVLEYMKKKMDDAKNDITKRHNILVAHNDDSWSQGKADGFREAIEIIDKHLGKDLK